MGFSPKIFLKDLSYKRISIRTFKKKLKLGAASCVPKNIPSICLFLNHLGLEISHVILYFVRAGARILKEGP